MTEPTQPKIEGDLGPMDIQAILRIAPHRYPFLMVDRVHWHTATRAEGYKNITYNEPCFTGHFPGRPIFPGVLQIEAIAQIGGMLVLSRPENLGKLAFFTAVDEVKFRRQVVPGDQLKLEAEITREKRNLCVVKGKASVDGQMSCEATVSFMVVEEKRAE
jgi:3-hydroxyacyl-[acyl-carrier-protein] dehydratase